MPGSRYRFSTLASLPPGQRLSGFAATPMRRLATSQSPRANLFCSFVPLRSGFSVLHCLSHGGVLGFLCSSRYPCDSSCFAEPLSKPASDSKHRATVLSFRGLAVNVSYGLMSIAAVAVTAVEKADPTTTQTAAFDWVIQMLPWYFLLAAVGFTAWARRRAKDDKNCMADGFTRPTDFTTLVNHTLLRRNN